MIRINLFIRREGKGLIEEGILLEDGDLKARAIFLLLDLFRKIIRHLELDDYRLDITKRSHSTSFNELR